MKGPVRSLLVWTAVCLVGYYLYRPLPAGVAEPFKTWQIITLLNIMHDTVKDMQQIVISEVT